MPAIEFPSSRTKAGGMERRNIDRRVAVFSPIPGRRERRATRRRSGFG
jgi:hypothetical protein